MAPVSLAVVQNMTARWQVLQDAQQSLDTMKNYTAGWQFPSLPDDTQEKLAAMRNMTAGWQFPSLPDDAQEKLAAMRNMTAAWQLPVFDTGSLPALDTPRGRLQLIIFVAVVVVVVIGGLISWWACHNRVGRPNRLTGMAGVLARRRVIKKIWGEKAWTLPTDYQNLRDEDRDRERADSTVRSPRCDMILLVHYNKNLTDADEEERQSKLDLIGSRLFLVKSKRAEREERVVADPTLLDRLTCGPKKEFDIYYLSMRRHDILSTDNSSDIKEERIKRLMRRLATRDQMMKRRRTRKDFDKESKKSGFHEAQTGLRELQPFDETLQPFEDRFKDGTPKDGAFQYARKDEWVGGERGLFTSKERIHLLRLALEQPEEEGGCGLDINKAEGDGWFTAVPVHDGCRTRTQLFPDDHEEQLRAPPPLDRQPSNAKTLWTSIQKKMKGWYLASHAVHLASRAEGRHRFSMPHAPAASDKYKGTDAQLHNEGTLVESWYRQPLTLLPELPLDDIHDYYDSKTALYFAFLELLTQCMLIPASLGLVWSVLLYYYFGTMDNWLASAYAIITVIWSNVFTKLWQRRCNELAFKWNIEDVDRKENHRYQFDKMDIEKSTGLYSKEGFFVELNEKELKLKHKEVKELPRYDRQKRFFRQALSWLVISVFLTCSFTLIFGWLSLRVFLMTYYSQLSLEKMFGIELLFENRVLLGSTIGTLCNTLWTLLSNKFGKWMATKLNNYESYRTGTHYESALLIKKFAILTINTYSPLFYIAFLKATSASQVMGFVFFWLNSLWRLVLDTIPDVTTDYCHDMQNFDVTDEEIRAAHMQLNPFCMAELTTFLLQTLLIRFATQDLAGVALRYFTDSCKAANEKPTFYERQAKLSKWEGVQDASLDLVLLIGLVVLFAPALPLAALIVFLTGLFRLRTDAYKLLKLHRRPEPTQKKDIAGVKELLDTLSFAGVLVNVALIFFTATQIRGLVAEGNVVQVSIFYIDEGNLFLIFVAVEHLILLINFVVMQCMMNQHPVIDKRRTKETVELKEWKRTVETELKQQEAQEAHENLKRALEEQALNEANAKRANPAEPSGEPFPFGLGPFQLVTIDHKSLDFSLTGAGKLWQVNQGSKQLKEHRAGCHDDAHSEAQPPKAVCRSMECANNNSAEHAAEHVHSDHVTAVGRLSEPSFVTLTGKGMNLAGIDDRAFEFAFAYPASRFAGVSEGPELLTDLELDLHKAVKEAAEAEPFDAKTAKPCKWCSSLECGQRAQGQMCPERTRHDVLYFLAIGGFVYFDKEQNVIQVTSLVLAKEGLSFRPPMCGLPTPTFGGQTKKDQKDLHLIGEVLDQRGAFQRPTFPFLKEQGITGFCWIKPGETFYPRNEEANAKHKELRERKEKMTVVDSSSWSVFKDESKDEELKQELERYREREGFKKHWEQKAKEWWPDGAFVYRYAGGKACRFSPVHTTLQKGSDLQLRQEMLSNLYKAWLREYTTKGSKFANLVKDVEERARQQAAFEFGLIKAAKSIQIVWRERNKRRASIAAKAS